MKDYPLYSVKKITDIKDLLNQSAVAYREKNAFYVKDKPEGSYRGITFGRFKEDVDAFGTALMDIGLEGSKIAIIGENRYQWAVSYMAVVNGTGTVVPIDKELPESELQSLLVRCQAKAVIFSPRILKIMERIKEKIPDVTTFISMDNIESKIFNAVSFESLLEKGSKLLKEGIKKFVDIVIDREKISILLFTSATTDIAKCVMLSHKNIVSNIMYMCSLLYIDEKDVFISVLPLHHTYECTCGFLTPIYRGCSIAYAESLKSLQKNISESKATMMLGVPLLFESIYKRIWSQAAKDPKTLKSLKTGIKLSNFLRKIGIDMRKKLFAKIHNNFGGSLRLFISGAAALDPEVSAGFRNIGIDMLQGYGLTECSPILGVNRDYFYKDGAAGYFSDEIQVKISQPNEEGIGEIICKGDNIMAGYYQNENATSESLKDGWFYTGDLGYIDRDSFIFITGRKKNVIITKNGKNIYPEEIEALLSRHEIILESLVYAMEEPDGSDICLAVSVVPNMEYVQESMGKDIKPDGPEVKAKIEEIIKEINKGLVIYKHIKHIKIRTEEFVKTTTKKIKRYEAEEIKK